MIKIIFIFIVFFPFSVLSASFDCAKAKTSIEKMICENKSLSKLDGQLNKTYKQALTKTDDKKLFSQKQLDWLKVERDKCQDIVCLNNAYQRRISDLQDKAVIGNFELINDNCRSSICWWQYAKNKKVIKSVNSEKLVSVITMQQTAVPTRSHSDNIEDFSEETWWQPIEVFVFCAKKLPIVIECERGRKNCVGKIPFPESTATGDDAAIYYYACGKIEVDEKEIAEQQFEATIALDNLLHIFEYYKSLK